MALAVAAAASTLCSFNYSLCNVHVSVYGRGWSHSLDGARVLTTCVALTVAGVTYVALSVATTATFINIIFDPIIFALTYAVDGVHLHSLCVILIDTALKECPLTLARTHYGFSYHFIIN